MERFETGRQSPEISEEKKELLGLEQTGLYVFHGSPSNIEQLEPRQSLDTERGNDGAPAVFVSPKADYAVFMAVLAPLGRTSVGTTSHENGRFSLTFSASPNTLARLTDESSGWVYVLEKENFELHNDNPSELKSMIPQRSVKKIRVFRRDLPPNIRVLDQ